ncbi:MAG TPA: LacI family DNA-binding transcriptional regulator [Spirochaetota bacterium]|nr:LacI family DNA-binding transcriptional regulator [Spirochaetota bacterium]
MTKKSTIKDIARITGYSVATVSRALNEFSNVTYKTKQKILEASKKLNYVPNLAAQNLVKGKSKVIGLVLPDAGPLHRGLVNYINEEVKKNNFLIINYNSNNSQEAQRFYIESLLRQQVDAIILSPIPGNYKIMDEILSYDTPIIILDRFLKDYNVNHILFDFRKGISQAIDILVENGRRHFFQLARQDIYYGIERRNIFYFSLKANGITYRKNHTLPVDDQCSSGYAKMSELLKNEKKIDTVFCSSDITAMGAIRAAVDKGCRIPEDIAVVGCYNLDFSEYYVPRISTIHTDFKKLAQKLVNRLFALLKDPDLDVANQNLPTGFVAKDTT